MIASFHSDAQEELFATVISELEGLGYRGELLERDYPFPDYFQEGTPERKIPAAAFGQTPVSYKTACFGVLLANGDSLQGKQLVESCRSLGAPIHFEVREDRVVCWIVGRDAETTRIEEEYNKRDLHRAFERQASLWSPESVLRAKNIGQPRGERQLDFYDAGLITALEEQIEQKLDPILKDALATAQRTYKRTASTKPDERELFRLAFRLLAGKIFHDRGVQGFQGLTEENGPDPVLRKVADHYREPVLSLLNLPARQAAFERIWSRLDFRNLSIDVLTTIWSKTLVTKKVRRALGIHTTPRTIASYIVNNLPEGHFKELREVGAVVVEPCCGSATFLVEAMQRIREGMPHSLSPQQRHAYFQDVLVGFEVETFGVEIARLCLALADFPNPNGWNIYEENVFTSSRLPMELKKSKVVLCNPPFESLTGNDPLRAHVQSPHKPAEILHRVLLNLHPEGVLGFVLPRSFLNSPRYRKIRESLVRRFAGLELVSLPDIAFRDSESQHETVLLLTKNPQQNGQMCEVRHLRVTKSDWNEFSKRHRPTTDDVSVKTVDEAAKNLAVPLLKEIWEYLDDLPKLRQIAKGSRGIEWNRPLRNEGEETGVREQFILDRPQPWTRQGVPPLAKIYCFQQPETRYLNMRPEDQRRNAYKCPWDRPKVIMNASRRSRGPWRISAFADVDGLACHRSFFAIWPNEPTFVTVLAAVLNAPVANAFVTALEGRYISLRELRTLPVPEFTERLQREVEETVGGYLNAVENNNYAEADTAIRNVDSLVLKAYDLPPRLERKLLNYFRGAERPVPFDFEDYFPADFEPCFSLAYYLSKACRASTAGQLRSRRERPPDSTLKAMRAAVDAYEEE